MKFLDPSITSAYDSFIWTEDSGGLAEKLYANPPKTMGSLAERIDDLIRRYDATNWFDESHFKSLKEGLFQANRLVSTLTPEVTENINRLSNGGIEAAHQTVSMGGPCYILNKAATSTAIARFAQSSGHDITPFFFVAEYDIVQPELTNIRTPLMGHAGNLISVPVPEGFEYSPVSALPLPRESDWYDQVEESVLSNYRPIFKTLEGYARSLVDERLEQALKLIRWAYVNSSTLSEWSLHILGRVLNIEGNLGIPLLPSSAPILRQMMIRGMEYLLSKDVREVFLRVHEESTNLIRSEGYNPGMGERNTDFVPFYYECPQKQCHKSRTELQYQEKAGIVLLSGKCPTCGEEIQIETSSTNPNLENVRNNLSPRVDTRQMIIDMIFPVLAHVGGSGETAYYAQVIPIANKLEIPFPLYLKYPRVYFNTPWNENLANELKQKGVTVLHRSEMFKIMGAVNKSRRKKNTTEMNAALGEFEKILKDTHSTINEELNTKITKLSTPEGRKDTDLVNTRLEIERYLSWTFGQYTNEKLGQESTWSWIEWALNAGFPDLFGAYFRAYVPEMNNGATLFINFSI
ncbi:MAG: bacillithiol biosynthesis BshC [Candidatus Thorarchaeota archaeon]